MPAHLERREVVHDLIEAERLCPCCGQVRDCIGSQTAGQLARSGVLLARSTLGDWLAGAADLLDPLYHLMHQRLLLSRVLHSDDTHVKLRVPGADRTRRAHLWAYLGDADYPYVVFDFIADSTAAGPNTFLAGYQGYLQADALAQYETLYVSGPVQQVCCWAHARRKFVTAFEGGETRAQGALDHIRRLYAIERELPPSDEAADQERRRQCEEWLPDWWLLRGNYSRIPSIGAAGSTPVRRCSRPW